jgi:hypothetical protein
MYTKFTLVLFTAIILSGAVTGINSQKQNFEIPKSTLEGHATTTPDDHRQTIPWAPLWADNYNEHIRGHKHDDDGKSHEVHFNRVQQRKRRILYCVGGKVILMISYLCALLSFYFQMRYS